MLKIVNDGASRADQIHGQTRSPTMVTLDAAGTRCEKAHAEFADRTTTGILQDYLMIVVSNDTRAPGQMWKVDAHPNGCAGDSRGTPVSRAAGRFQGWVHQGSMKCLNTLLKTRRTLC